MKTTQKGKLEIRLCHEAIYRQPVSGNLLEENSFTFKFFHDFKGDSDLQKKVSCAAEVFLLHTVQLVAVYGNKLCDLGLRFNGGTPTSQKI